jgi:hypothetical protein
LNNKSDSAPKTLDRAEHEIRQTEHGYGLLSINQRLGRPGGTRTPNQGVMSALL